MNRLAKVDSATNMEEMQSKVPQEPLVAVHEVAAERVASECGKSARECDWEVTFGNEEVYEA